MPGGKYRVFLKMALGHKLFSFRWIAKSNKVKVATHLSGYNFLMKKMTS